MMLAGYDQPPACRGRSGWTNRHEPNEQHEAEADRFLGTEDAEGVSFHP
jgi:hypothetical protein